MAVARNHYDLLGVSRNADSAELHSAFRSLSKTLHPDTTSLPVEEAAKKFRQLCESYELLADPAMRAIYDASLDLGNPSGSNQFVDYSASNPKDFLLKDRLANERRPLSGGELLSLFLLGISILLSLLLAVGFAFLQGRELQSQPSWLIVDRSNVEFISNNISDVANLASSRKTIESTFIDEFGSLVAKSRSYSGGT